MRRSSLPTSRLVALAQRELGSYTRNGDVISLEVARGLARVMGARSVKLPVAAMVDRPSAVFLSDELHDSWMAGRLGALTSALERCATTEVHLSGTGQIAQTPQALASNFPSPKRPDWLKRSAPREARSLADAFDALVRLGEGGRVRLGEWFWEIGSPCLPEHAPYPVPSNWIWMSGPDGPAALYRWGSSGLFSMAGRIEAYEGAEPFGDAAHRDPASGANTASLNISDGRLCLSLSAPALGRLEWLALDGELSAVALAPAESAAPQHVVFMFSVPAFSAWAPLSAGMAISVELPELAMLDDGCGNLGWAQFVVDVVDPAGELLGRTDHHQLPADFASGLAESGALGRGGCNAQTSTPSEIWEHALVRWVRQNGRLERDSA